MSPPAREGGRTVADRGRAGFDPAATRAVVVGLGVSGEAAARALLAAGVRSLRLVERSDTGPVRERADRLGVEALLGEVDPHRAVAGADLLVVSPGVPERHPAVAEAMRRGLPVWSEPELAWRLAEIAGGGEPGTTLVAVTGTNGKTTTTELLAACLGAPAAGNIGPPLTDALTGPAPPPLVVAELSSFQLRFCERLRPSVAVVLNIAPDHLDWHGSLAAYRAAKAGVWRSQRRGDWAVANADDPGVVDLLAEHPPPASLLTFTAGPPAAGQVGVDGGRIAVRAGEGTVEVVAVEDLGAKGPHNLANVLAAVAASVAAGADPRTLGDPLRRYRPGAHRLEVVGEHGGVAFVDDSKATNPHAAAAALATFPRVVWIAGGLNKGLAFDALAGPVRERVRAAVTIGESGPAIAALVRDAGVPVVEAGEMGPAVRAASELARPGDTVLLSPACASMDQFADYAERGRAFRDAVSALPATVTPQTPVPSEVDHGG